MAIAPPLISMGSQFGRRILRAHWVARIEVPGLGVTPKAKTDGILKRVRAAVGFLHNVMNVNAASTKLMTDAAPAM